MKIQDLMVGDWVKNDLGETQQVVELREKGVMLSYNDIYPYDYIDPIPITPEILEKNGWRLWDIEGEFKQMDSIVVFGRKAPFSVFDGIVINYVHELQHALRLCGINKEIVV